MYSTYLFMTKNVKIQILSRNVKIVMSKFMIYTFQ